MPPAVRRLRLLLWVLAAAFAVAGVFLAAAANREKQSLSYALGYAFPTWLLALAGALLARGLPRRSGRAGLFVYTILAMLGGAALVTSAPVAAPFVLVPAVAALVTTGLPATAAYVSRHGPRDRAAIAALAEDDEAWPAGPGRA